ncbi:universal stress protein [Flagellimonas lutaonensis]|uniref:Universal stress protein n=1 Tax=Flagellimonas lutaonensis TaxID=516051 RepID=A0A0D5YPT8_9FLAO|nr:universal stress protein [Allomuricauda lutaonensis]AKA34242.1 universal stress protein [Allomuricauda lutaonensis]
MKTILIPTDFSDNAWNAICYALEFFKEETAKFYLLHTYTPVFYRMDYLIGGPAYSAIPDIKVDVSLAGLERTLKDIKKQFPNPNHSFETVSAFNTLTDEINELTDEKNIDLVVMGTKGATGAKQLFLGSNAVFVIRKAKIPVLAIPESSKFTKMENILFPTDYWSKYKIKELRSLIEIAEEYMAKITVLHVKELPENDLTDKQEQNKKHLKNCLKEVPYQFTEIQGKLMPDAILEHIEDHDFQLLAMMNKEHSFFERLLIKQNVDQIGFHVKIPFLIIRDTSEVTN